jgi:hypothetical protein
MSAVADGLGVDGKLLVVGATADPIEVTPLQLIGRRASVAGWLSGTAADSGDTMRFSVLAGVRAMVETLPLERGPMGYARMSGARPAFGSCWCRPMAEGMPAHRRASHRPSGWAAEANPGGRRRAPRAREPSVASRGCRRRRHPCLGSVGRSFGGFTASTSTPPAS